jgi:hypothetical protein
MKRWFLITAVLLLSSAWMIAQSSNPPTAPDNSQSTQPSSQQPDTSQSKEPASSDHQGHTIEGCITSVAGGYTLTDNSGKTYQLAGDTSKLANENGHWDQVSGTEEGSAGGAASSSGASSSGAPTTFTVRKIKVVSTTCPTK